MLRPAAPARALRGALVAVVGLGIATAGHVYAGGAASPTPLLVLVGVLVTAATMLASRARWTASRLVVVLLGMQVAVHAALWFDDTGVREVDGRLAALAALASGSSVHQHVATPGSSTVGMVVAHLVAVVVAAVLLAAIDGALWLLQALARLILRAVAGIATPALPRGVVDVRGAVAVGVLALGAVGRRGPPVGAAPA